MYDTRFAPAERDDAETVRAQAREVQANPMVSPLLDAVPDILAVLNEKRQIILANQQFLSSLGIRDFQSLLGQRPGEAFHCIHSHGAGGCGTTGACRYCGAVQAVLACQETRQPVTRDARLTVEGPDGQNIPMDVKVHASPFLHGGVVYTLVTLQDISPLKRRQVLERMFFHDVLNTAGGLNGLASLMAQEDEVPEIRKLAGMVNQLGSQLIEEILEQRQLISAENGDLEVTMESIPLGEVVRQSIQAMDHHKIAQDRHIMVDDAPVYPTCRTDPVLARRIVINMIKNALEATPRGGTVRVALEGPDLAGEGMCAVSIRNPGVMPQEVQMQIFQRSFSTKGTGRGIGTYSMKLLGEQYLGGSIVWHSTPAEGTVFSLRLPVSPE